MKMRLTVNMESMKIDLPVVISSIHGIVNSDQFIMIGYQLGNIEQSRIINEIIKAYINQIKNGWSPKFVFKVEQKTIFI